MLQPKLNKQTYTYIEYLELEKKSDLKHEFYYGEIFSMAGTTRTHNDVVFNLAAGLKKLLKNVKKSCFVNFESVKVEITNKFHYAYPDVVVTCSDNEDDPLSIKFPVLIIEVLSDSTRQYDKDQKFEFYKQIKSLKHYVLVEQNQCFINSYTLHKDMWVHKSYSKEENLVELSHLKINIPVKDIYENIEYEKNPDFPFLHKK